MYTRPKILLSGHIDEGIVRIVEAIGNLGSTSSNPSHDDPEEEVKTSEEKEVKASGARAFAGILAGGAIGLFFGPAGVIIGGLLGAAIGNQLEYNGELERRKREKEKLANE